MNPIILRIAVIAVALAIWYWTRKLIARNGDGLNGIDVLGLSMIAWTSLPAHSLHGSQRSRLVASPLWSTAD